MTAYQFEERIAFSVLRLCLPTLAHGEQTQAEISSLSDERCLR